VALKTLFRHWQQGMHNRAWNALFWCNHDQPRIVSRFGDEGEYRVPAAKMLAMVLHGMQGTPYIYQGEEMGMTNPHFSRITDYRDVESLNMFAELRASGREPDELLAILASKSATTAARRCSGTRRDNAGFTEVSRGLASAITTESTPGGAGRPGFGVLHLSVADSLRKTLPVLTWGDYQDLLEHPSLWCYRRQWQGQTLMVAANLSRPQNGSQRADNWQVHEQLPAQTRRHCAV
jgi:trehalose-6-phosphate hydrolase